MKKNLLSLLLAMCMLLSIFPVTALAESESGTAATFSEVIQRTEALNLTGTSVSYTSADGSTTTANPQNDSIEDTAEGWAWIPGNNTDTPNILYLDGVNFNIASYNGVLLPDNTKILVSGQNTITMAESGAYILALRSQGNLEITSTAGGALVVTAGDAGSHESKAVCASGQLTISGSVRLQAAGGRSNMESCGLSSGGSILIKDSAQVSAYGKQAPKGFGIVNDEAPSPYRTAQPSQLTAAAAAPQGTAPVFPQRTISAFPARRRLLQSAARQHMPASVLSIHGTAAVLTLHRAKKLSFPAAM